jgi:hypothetical protein
MTHNDRDLNEARRKFAERRAYDQTNLAAEWNDSRQQWAGARQNADRVDIDGAELRSENRRLRLELETRVHRSHAALLVLGSFFAGAVLSAILGLVFHG